MTLYRVRDAGPSNAPAVTLSDIYVHWILANRPTPPLAQYNYIVKESRHKPHQTDADIGDFYLQFSELTEKTPVEIDLIYFCDTNILQIAIRLPNFLLHSPLGHQRNSGEKTYIYKYI